MTPSVSADDSARGPAAAPQTDKPLVVKNPYAQPEIDSGQTTDSPRVGVATRTASPPASGYSEIRARQGNWREPQPSLHSAGPARTSTPDSPREFRPTVEARSITDAHTTENRFATEGPSQPANPYALEKAKSSVPRPLKWGPMSRWIAPIDDDAADANDEPTRQTVDLDLAPRLAVLPSDELVTPPPSRIWQVDNEIPLETLLHFPEPNSRPLGKLRQPETLSLTKEPLGPELNDPRFAASEIAVVSDRDRWQEASFLAQSAQSRNDFQVLIAQCESILADATLVDRHVDAKTIVAWALNRHGELQAEAGDNNSAMEDFTAALEYDPNCWLALHNRGVSFAQRGLAQEALRDFNSAIALNPGLIAARRNRGELYCELGRFEEAIADYSVGIAQDQNRADLLVLRAQTHQQLRQFHRAWDDYSAALRVVGESPELYVGRANILAEAEQFGMAVSDLQQALTLDPQHPDAYRSLALLLANCPDERYHDPRRAVYAARQAVRYATGDDGTVYESLAFALEANGQLDLAAKALRQAMKLMPAERQRQLEMKLTEISSRLEGKPQKSLHSPIRRVIHQAITPPQ